MKATAQICSYLYRRGAGVVGSKQTISLPLQLVDLALVREQSLVFEFLYEEECRKTRRGTLSIQIK